MVPTATSTPAQTSPTDTPTRKHPTPKERAYDLAERRSLCKPIIYNHSDQHTLIPNLNTQAVLQRTYQVFLREELRPCIIYLPNREKYVAPFHNRFAPAGHSNANPLGCCVPKAIAEYLDRHDFNETFYYTDKVCKFYFGNIPHAVAHAVLNWHLYYLDLDNHHSETLDAFMIIVDRARVKLDI